jgi:hypothetical protein
VRVAAGVVSFGAVLFLTSTLVGVASVDAALAAEWSGSSGGVLVSLGIGSPELVVTRPLLQVAAFLAALGGLSFAVEVVADANTRRTLVGDLVGAAGGAAAEGGDDAVSGRGGC